MPCQDSSRLSDCFSSTSFSISKLSLATRVRASTSARSSSRLGFVDVEVSETLPIAALSLCSVWVDGRGCSSRLGLSSGTIKLRILICDRRDAKQPHTTDGRFILTEFHGAAQSKIAPHRPLSTRLCSLRSPASAIFAQKTAASARGADGGRVGHRIALKSRCDVGALVSPLLQKGRGMIVRTATICPSPVCRSAAAARR